VVRRTSILGLLLIGVTIVSLVNSYATTPLQVSAQERESGKLAANPGHRPYQRQDTWYEFMLKQINPKEVDYGRWLERERQAFIKTRLKNPYFLYSLGTTIGLLLMAVVCVKLRIDHRRAMSITAEMMTDIYNQDAYSRRIAEEAIEKYNTHIERCNRVIEAVEHGEPVPGKGSEIEQLRGELACVASERDTATRERDLAREELRKKSEVLAEMSMRLEALTKKSGPTGGPKPASDQRGADAKLLTHINNLQEQLYAERNNNRRLKGG
jgi:hypothetical protein